MAKTVNKRRIIVICVIAAIVIAAAAGIIAAIKSGGGETVNVYSMDNIAMDSYWGDVSETEGRVRTDKMQSVYLSKTQSVVELLVSEGQSVKEGDVIAEFDTTLSDIERERQRITVEKTELKLTEAKKDLNTINGYTPYVPPVAEPEPEPEELPSMALPYKEGGLGTEEKPYIYLWNDDCWYTDSFINGILPLEKLPGEPDTPDVPDTPDTPDIPGEGDGENSGNGDENEVQTETGDTDNGSGGTDTGDTQPVPDRYAECSVWVVFETRQYDNTDGELIKYWGLRFTRNSDGSYKFAVYEPEPDYNKSEDDTDNDIDDDSSDIPSGPQYTAAEIAQMKSEKQQEIRDLELQVKVEQVKYDKLKLELESGTVTAKLDGVIKTIADPDEAQMNGTPYIVISGGGGYYIQGTLNELELDTIKIGQTVTVNSWMNGIETEGTIVEISDMPTTDGYNWTNGNQNVSYYPFTVFVDEDAALTENEYVSIQYSPAETGNGIYLELPFVLSENSKSYVYVADENGKLEKREVTTGKNLWSSYVEIKSGITMEDNIAFPYGKNIKEGAQTVVASIDELYSSY